MCRSTAVFLKNEPVPNSYILRFIHFLKVISGLAFSRNHSSNLKPNVALCFFARARMPYYIDISILDPPSIPARK